MPLGVAEQSGVHIKQDRSKNPFHLLFTNLLIRLRGKFIPVCREYDLSNRLAGIHVGIDVSVHFNVLCREASRQGLCFVGGNVVPHSP